MLNEALSSAEESSSEAEKSKEKHWILNTKVLVARLQGISVVHVLTHMISKTRKSQRGAFHLSRSFSRSKGVGRSWNPECHT